MKNGIKRFFKKVSDYIKNTAWLQPLLIVVVIFLVLFLLNPITTGIKSLWNTISTSNNMKKVSYKDYITTIENSYNKDIDIYSDDSNATKYIVVFTQSDSDACTAMYEHMNDYLKQYVDSSFKVLNVSIDTKTKLDKTVVYKDKTMGVADGSKDDYLKLLDQRIENYVAEGGNYTEYSSQLSSSSDGLYTYVTAPLFVWYVNGIEVRISNQSEFGNYSDFTSFMKFPTSSKYARNWDATEDKFNLTYKA